VLDRVSEGVRQNLLEAQAIELRKVGVRRDVEIDVEILLLGEGPGLFREQQAVVAADDRDWRPQLVAHHRQHLLPLGTLPAQALPQMNAGEPTRAHLSTALIAPTGDRL
jgi:hypothetical protein